MNLISVTHHSCERKEYAFMIFQEYTIISWGRDKKGEKLLIGYLRFYSNVNIKRNKLIDIIIQLYHLIFSVIDSYSSFTA